MRWDLGGAFMQLGRSGCQGAWPLTAVSLVLAMFTVVFFVTGPAHGDAPPTGAGKVIEWAPGTLHAWEQKGGVRTL